LDILSHIEVYFKDPRCRQNVIYCYNQWQPKLDEFKKKNVVTEWINGLPSSETILEKTEPFKDSGGSICVIDDFGQALSKGVVEMLTVMTAHMATIPILLV
jgi:hypothetical protein